MSWSLAQFFGLRDMFTFCASPLGHDADLLLPGCGEPEYCREYGCAGDCSEASEPADIWGSDAEHAAAIARNETQDEHVWLGNNASEPALSDDELVAVRQLIEERFPSFAGAAASLADDSNPSRTGNWSSVREDKQPVAPHKTSPERVPPVPAGERAAGVEPSPSAPPAARPNFLSWEGWALPAIMTVLDEHNISTCASNHYGKDGVLSDRWEENWATWCDHVAPLIAEAINCDPIRAASALLGLQDLSPTSNSDGPGIPLVGDEPPAADSDDSLTQLPARGDLNDQWVNEWAAASLRRHYKF